MQNTETHRIDEQNSSYRRGLVLGLTMAEVGILIIFVLLLLIALAEMERSWALAEEVVEVPRERLADLERSSSELATVAADLGIGAVPVDQIAKLVRSERTSAAATANELQIAREELVRLRSAQPGSEDLAELAKRQSFRLENQEGQLRRCEESLAKVGLGKGERPCWAKPDGTIEYLFDVVLVTQGIRLRYYDYPHRVEEKSRLPLPPVDPVEIVESSEFLRRTRPLYESSLALNCRYFVVVFDGTGPTEKERYKQLLRTVEGHFYKRLSDAPPPF